MSKAADLWQTLPPEQLVVICERMGVVFDLDEKDRLTYTLPIDAKASLSDLIEGKREVIHSVIWCKRLNMPLWYWYTIHSPRYTLRLNH